MSDPGRTSSREPGAATPTDRIPLSRIEIDPALESAILRAVRSGTYILGPECRAFESELAASLGRRHAVLVASATSAAQLVHEALGLAAGAEVIVPSHTAFPTIEAILRAGATPVFAEIDPDAYVLDPADTERRITPRTRAIVPVHLYGHPCDLDAIADLARRNGLLVIEDCAQAQGALFRGRPVGSAGIAATLSFYPSKNVPVLGDGGAVVTDDDALAARVRRLRDHGRSGKHVHEEVGWNLRFDEIQAAVGRHFLARLEANNERRRAVADRYRARLAGRPGVILPVERPWARHVYHLFVVRVPGPGARDAVARSLEAAGIQTGVHYPIPTHRQPAIRALGGVPADLSATDAAAAEVLSLPMFPSIPDADVDRVCEALACSVRPERSPRV